MLEKLHEWENDIGLDNSLFHKKGTKIIKCILSKNVHFPQSIKNQVFSQLRCWHLDIFPDPFCNANVIINLGFHKIA